jgi:acetolactate synthase-1/2/3 large subunit
LTLPEQDHTAALEQLMGELNLDNITIAPEPQVRPELPAASSDSLSADLLCRTIAALLPENAIVTDESITQGRSFYGHSHTSARHDYLQLTGGAIGIGLPLATGAAVACPQRKVVSLQADGSGMYTVQALWTQARENLDCLTIVFANRRYAILEHEMKNVGVAQMGDNARSMLQIDRPDISWVKLADGLGVPAVRASNLREFTEAFERGLRHRGPFLIEAELLA